MNTVNHTSRWRRFIAILTITLIALAVADVRSQGTIHSTGNNGGGQLGLGDTTARTAFEAVSTPTNVVAFSNASGAYAITSDGALWATGSNGYGQLGLGDLIDRSSYEPVSDLANVAAVAGGGTHTLVVLEDGTLWAAGEDDRGQLGLSSSDTKTLFTQVPDMFKVIAVAAFARYSIAIKADGSVWATGANNEGQLGLGDNEDRNYFTQVTNLQGARSASAYGHTVVVTHAGEVWTTGKNWEGELGFGDTTDRNTFTQVPDLTNVRSACTAYCHTVVVKNDGTVWGAGYADGLGMGTGSPVTTFTALAAITNVKACSTGSWFTIALKEDGALWGIGYRDGMGLGGDDIYVEEWARLLPEKSAIGAIGTLSESSYALDGAAYHLLSIDVVSANDIAITGTLSCTTFANRLLPVDSEVTLTAPATALPANRPFSHWELNGVAQSQDETTVTFTLDRATVAKAVYASATGTVCGTGYDTTGNLGLGTTGTKYEFTTIPVLENIVAVDDVLALKSDGTVWSTRPKDVSQTYYSQLSGVSDVVAVASHFRRQMLLLEDGTLLACGRNTNGELGFGDTNTVTDYTVVPGMSKVTGIAIGMYHTIAVKADGTVWTCGDNQYGQLGMGDNTDKYVFTQVPDITTAVAVAAYMHSVVLLRDGAIQTVGHNGSGALGLGDLSNRSSFVQVPSMGNVRAIAAYASHSMLLKNDGTVWAAGPPSHFADLMSGETGQSFVQLGTVSGGVAISTGEMASLLLKQDGSVWGMGRNEYGELGLGDSYPVASGWEQLPVPTPAGAICIKDMCSRAVEGSRHHLVSIDSSGCDSVAISGSVSCTTFSNQLLPADSEVALEAPATASDGANDRPFARWIVNGVPLTDGESTATFTLENPTVAEAVYAEKKVFAMAATFNLVSIPFTGSGVASAEDLCNEHPSIAGVWKWQVDTQTWHGHPAGGPNNFAISPGDGLLVAFSGDDDALPLFGEWATFQFTLKTGFNLVSHPNSLAALTTAEDLATSIPNCGAIWKWNAQSQSWTGHPTGGPNNFAVAPGDCFLVYVTADGTWPE